MKKSTLESTRFIRHTSKPFKETRVFSVSSTDLQRRFVLTLINGPDAYNKVSSATIKLNGKTVFLPQNFNAQVANLSVTLSDLNAGDNTLDVELSSKPNAALDLKIDGFALPQNTPGAIHSLIADTPDIRSTMRYRPGRVGIKFLEGMKVRLNSANGIPSQLLDQTGISLTQLQNWMARNKVSRVDRAIGIDPQILDDDEIKVETLMLTEAPNQNLFYYLNVDAKADIWRLVDELRTLPFIEEAYPDFIFESAGYSPSDPPFLPDSSGNLPVFDYTNTVTAAKLTIPQNTWLKDLKVIDNGDNKSAWQILSVLGKPGGDPNVKVAVVDSGPQHKDVGLGSTENTHEDLTHIQFLSNIAPSPYDSTAEGATFPYTNLIHGTGTTGIVGAQGNNNKGVAGVSFGSQILGLHAFAPGYQSQCLGTGAKGCDAGADAIWLARNQRSKVIIVEAWGGGCYGSTIEQHNSVVRAAIAGAVANQISVMVPAGNNANQDTTDITVARSFGSGISSAMPDTGSIIVGGIQRDQSRRSLGDCVYKIPSPGKSPIPVILPKRAFNYGVSGAAGPNNLYTDGLGHGTDVSAAGDGSIFTTAYVKGRGDGYGSFGGTSGATPAVGGIVALMLSVKPDLTPLEIRKTLRNTRNGIITDPSPGFGSIAGMANAYLAVNTYTSMPPSSNVPGLFGKFYANTLYLPPALYLNDLDAPTFQIPHQPIAVKTVPNLDFAGSGQDLFGVGLNQFFVADFQGELTVSSAGVYHFALNHDDGAMLMIDNQPVIQANNAPSGSAGLPQFSQHSVNLSAGEHSIRVLRYQYLGRSDLSLWWKKPGASNFEIVPPQNLSHSSTIEVAAHNPSIKPHRLIAYFFRNTLTSEPPAVPIGSKGFFNIDFVGGNAAGDQFGVGLSDNFAAQFTGYLKLPAGYPAGNYTFRLWHDDGAWFYLGDQLLINNPGPHDFHLTGLTANQTLSQNVYYPIQVHYDEQAFEAEIRLEWRIPGSSTFETVPGSAFFH